MPADFDKCVKDGGKVITKIIKPNVNYMHVCYDKAGQSHSGDVKTYKRLSTKKNK